MAKYKNSGILRYTFGDAVPPSLDNPGLHGGQFPSLAGGGGITIIQCLGAGADVLTLDSDGQLFGGSPGHDEIIGNPNTLFNGTSLEQQPTQVLQANPPDRVTPAFYIPSGTKVFAFFVVTGASVAAIPGVLVQTEVVESRIRRGSNGNGNNVADATGDSYLASIRVAISNTSVLTALGGVLVVELQHSEHDIPGLPSQNLDFSVTPPA